MRVDHHLILVLPEVLNGIDHPGVTLEAQHELFGETVRDDFLRVVNRRFSSSKAPPPFEVINLLPRSASEQSPQCPRCEEPSKPYEGPKVLKHSRGGHHESKAPPLSKLLTYFLDLLLNNLLNVLDARDL